MEIMNHQIADGSLLARIVERRTYGDGIVVIYTDDEQRLVRAARDLASTLSEEITVEVYELKEFIEHRTAP